MEKQPRNNDLRTAQYKGTLRIAGLELSCAVLNDGTRVLSAQSVFKAFKRPRRGPRKRDPQVAIEQGFIQLPAFIGGKNLIPYMSDDLKACIQIIQYTDGKKLVDGYKAEILHELCSMYLRARRDPLKILTLQQETIAVQAEILFEGFARVGISALVDEVTGYQIDREKNALALILEKYLSKELAAWAKKFPDEFYKELFRLRGWKWSPTSVSRPSVVGKYTNDLIYQRLAPNILEELQARNPKNEKGHRIHKHHQWLSVDIGNPALSQHLFAVITLMKASSSWEKFYRLLDRSLPKKKSQILLELDDPNE